MIVRNLTGMDKTIIDAYPACIGILLHAQLEDVTLARALAPSEETSLREARRRVRRSEARAVEVILDNTLLYNNITEIITKEYVIMNEIQSY